MHNILQEYYPYLKTLHVIFVISWMAGLLYMPRLFVYHATATPGSELELTLQTMELRLYRIIMRPAIIGTFLFGLLMIVAVGMSNFGKWLHVKLLLVFIMAGMHGMMGAYRRKFMFSTNKHSPLFYRIFNEIPAILMIIIVYLVVIQPF